MKTETLSKSSDTSFQKRPIITERALTRIADADLLRGNEVKLLIDAAENYPAWYAAIEAAEDRIFFESYIIHEDAEGKRCAEALIKKAKQGVEVKLLYDWMGGWGNTSRKFWRHLRANGVDVRCFNPPQFLDPLAILSRDHRKTLIVDGKIAFVSGLCIGEDWVGHPDKNVSPWRDTGVQIRGAAVADVERAFAEVWAVCGAPLGANRLSKREDFTEAGNVAARVVQNVPSHSHTYRLDNVFAAGVRKTMYLTDAYFVGTPAYLEALKDAARDGVDVRVLVPQGTDIPIIRDTTRTTYRPLLESGVRVYEWNGSMVHAKTAVFDGKFSRVGSTNLNVASWFGNYELDIIVEDENFGAQMNEMFFRDLENSTEIVLGGNRKIQRKEEKPRRRTKNSGSVKKATAGALNTATSITSAIAKQAPLGRAESRLLALIGAGLVLIALLLLIFPRVFSIPIALILLLPAFTAITKAIKYYRDED